MNGVWVQIYVGGEKSGTEFGIYDETVDTVDELRVAVKEACKPDLDYCSRNKINVYATCTVVPTPESTEPHDLRNKVSDHYKQGNTLIVVALPPVQVPGPPHQPQIVDKAPPVRSQKTIEEFKSTEEWIAVRNTLDQLNSSDFLLSELPATS